MNAPKARRTRRATLISLILTLALLLAACSGADDADEEDVADADAPTEVDEGDAEETSEEEPAEDTEEPADEAEEPTEEEPEEVTCQTVRVAFAGSTLAPSAGIYTSLPEALGFWDEEGIHVEFVRVDGTAVALTSLAGGQIEVGVVSGDPVITAAMDGQDVVIPYVLSQQNIVATIVPTDSEVQAFADLDGQPVGVPTLTSGAIPFVQAAVAAEGGDPDSIEFIAVGTGASAATALQNGQVAAAVDTDSAVPVYQRAGVDVRLLESDLSETVVNSISAAVTGTYLDEHPEAVAAWAKGVAEATVWAAANPEAAVDLHYEFFPDELPEGDPQEVLDLSLDQLESRLASMDPGDGPYGEVTDEQWEGLLDFQLEYELLTERPEVSTFYDGSIIEQANDFDRDEVVARTAEDAVDTCTG